MNRFPRYTLALLVLLLFLATAPAIVSAQGGKDFAAGGGEGLCECAGNAILNVQFGFAASSDADGNNPRGHIVFVVPGETKAAFDVVCLNVTGNLAVIGGVSSSGQAPVQIFAQDNRELGVVDTFFAHRFGGVGPFPEPDCPVGQPPLTPIMRGNILVREAEQTE